MGVGITLVEHYKIVAVFMRTKLSFLGVFSVVLWSKLKFHLDDLYSKGWQKFILKVNINYQDETQILFRE